MRRIPLMLGAAVLTALSSLPSKAEMACGERDEIIAKLSDEFNEKRVGMGLGHDGQVVEVYASGASGSWTMLVTFPTRQTCLYGAGEAWQQNRPAQTQVPVSTKPAA
jgi:hypothetical protein